MNVSVALKTSAVLWVIWGMVHIVAGVMTLMPLSQGDTASAVHRIAGTVELTVLQTEYHPAVTAILEQHAWNLGWFGLVTLIGGLFVWRKNTLAILLCAIVGGLADTGYFLFVDLGGFASPPGPQMTWICAAAIILSAYAYCKRDGLQAM